MTQATTTTTESIEGWAIVEIMGHQQVAGYVKTQAFGGTAMLRVDVPDLPEVRKPVRCYGYGETPTVDGEEVKPAEPGHTQFVGMGSIYRLRLCDEPTARAVAERNRLSQPKILRLDTEKKALPGADGGEVEQLAQQFDRSPHPDGFGGDEYAEDNSDR